MGACNHERRGHLNMTTHPFLRVGLIQIGDGFGDQHYLPYAIGLLQGYAQSRLAEPASVQFGIPIYRRLPPDDAVKHLAGSHILFFSVYLWNNALSNEIAKRYRQRYPEAVIVFGGPQVPENGERLTRFMKENLWVDVACYTEGEEPFLKVLEHYQLRSWHHVPGVAFRTESGIEITVPPTRIEELDEIPSPYLSGIFDALMEQTSNGAGNWSALMETNRGCPFTCAFCYWGAGDRRRLRSYSLERVFAEIEWFGNHNIEFVFCCDANFGILPRDMDIVEKVAELKVQCGFPRAFSVQSTKNSTTKIFNLQKRLNDAGLQKGVNLALQSLHRPTLTAIERSNITTETYGELLSLFNSAGIPAFSDLILGLPEESYSSYTRGVEQVICQGQHNRIQFINLTVLENTAMAEPSYIERYNLHLVSSRIVSHHTSLTESSGISESQQLVVGTAALPPSDWRRARVFSWFMALFYFDRLLQIPLILLDRLTGSGLREIVEYCINHGVSLPVMGKLLTFMQEQASAIQSGKPEYVPSVEWMEMWWPLDEYLMISLMRNDLLESFYAEAAQLLTPFAELLPPQLLSDALRFNQASIKQPFMSTDQEIELSYPIPELYAAFQMNLDIKPLAGRYRYRIDRSTQQWDNWEIWMREMVWYGGKKGDYLYPCSQVARDNVV